MSIYPGSHIDNQNNEIIRKRLAAKKELWEGKDGAVVDLKFKTKDFGALLLLKVTDLTKGLN